MLTYYDSSSSLSFLFFNYPAPPQTYTLSLHDALPICTFLATIRPQLQAGQDTGWDLMVITNGIFFDQVKRNGWIIQLDQTRLTNFNKYASPIVKNPTYDPGNKYSVAWQSGYTGIGYDPDKTGKDITSFMDMFDPAFPGKVGY